MSDDFDRALAELKADFIAQLREDAAALSALSALPVPDGDADIGAIAHRIAGMAAVFGFDDLTERGKFADRAAKTGGDRDAITRFVAAVNETVAAL